MRLFRHPQLQKSRPKPASLPLQKAQSVPHLDEPHWRSKASRVQRPVSAILGDAAADELIVGAHAVDISANEAQPTTSATARYDNGGLPLSARLMHQTGPPRRTVLKVTLVIARLRCYSAMLGKYGRGSTASRSKCRVMFHRDGAGVTRFVQSRHNTASRPVRTLFALLQLF
jgi:hypothetical protein